MPVDEADYRDFKADMTRRMGGQERWASEHDGRINVLWDQQAHLNTGCKEAQAETGKTLVFIKTEARHAKESAVAGSTALAELAQSIKELNAWRWKAVGIVVGISIFMPILTTLVVLWLKGKE